MTKDRNDYRTMSDRELIDEVDYALADTDWRELAIVLAERLEATDYRRYADEY